MINEHNKTNSSLSHLRMSSVYSLQKKQRTAQVVHYNSLGSNRLTPRTFAMLRADSGMVTIDKEISISSFDTSRKVCGDIGQEFFKNNRTKMSRITQFNVKVLF